jgi:hypothetical protein
MMMDRKFLGVITFLIVCLLSACSGDGPQPEPTEQTDNQYTQDLKNAKESMNAAMESLRAAKGIVSPTASPTATIARTTSNTGRPSGSSVNRQNRNSSSPSDQTTPGNGERDLSKAPTVASVVTLLDPAIQKLNSVKTTLDPIRASISKPADGKVGTELDDVISTSGQAAIKLNTLKDALEQAEGPELKGALLNRTKTDLGDVILNLERPAKTLGTIHLPLGLGPTSFLSRWGTTLAIVVGMVLVLIILSILNMLLLKSARAEFENAMAAMLQQSAKNLQRQQTDLVTQVSAMGASQVQLATRLAEIQTEIRSLGRLVRDAALDGGRRSSATPASSQTDQTPPKDDPSFPISAGDYLERMRRFSSVVKPDFQNGILVDDPEGRGELALIRDARVPDDIQPLFVIPRSTQFQTKQDFHTYFEKYYDCQKPSAGEVWIIDPAVVSTVPGGWQLREKGVLEVR